MDVSRSFRVSERADYGVIFLSHPLSVKPFSVRKFPHDLESAKLATVGYPADKDDYTMWESEYQGFAVSKKYAGEILSGGVSYGAQSGSLVFPGKGNRLVANAILVAGTPCDKKGDCPREQATYIVSFSGEVLAEIREWIAMSN
jgi:hypothetical protein